MLHSVPSAFSASESESAFGYRHPVGLGAHPGRHDRGRQPRFVGDHEIDRPQRAVLLDARAKPRGPTPPKPNRCLCPPGSAPACRDSSHPYPRRSRRRPSTTGCRLPSRRENGPCPLRSPTRPCRRRPRQSPAEGQLNQIASPQSRTAAAKPALRQEIAANRCLSWPLRTERPPFHGVEWFRGRPGGRSDASSHNLPDCTACRAMRGGCGRGFVFRQAATAAP